jgi:hypothetical protein
MVIKPMRIKWVKNVACMMEMRNAYKIFIRNPQGKNHLGDLGVDGRIILKCILKIMCVWIGFNWLEMMFNCRV